MRIFLLGVLAVLSGCRNDAERAACGTVLLGARSDGRRMILASAGAECSGPTPRLTLSVDAPVERWRCAAGRLRAEGTDADGAPVQLDFEFSEPTELCNRGEGVMRLKKGERLVVAQQARVHTLD